MICVAALARRLAVLPALLVAAGCATHTLPPGHPPAHRAPEARVAAPAGHPSAWPLAALAQGVGTHVGVPTHAGVRWLDVAALRAAWAAAQRLQAAAPGAAPDYLIIDDPAANAFAVRRANGALIGINFGMVDLLGADEPAWGALIGHELAHLHLHHGAGQGARRDETGGMLAIASVLLMAVGFPLTPILAEMASHVADKAYSRDDEREADEAGIGYMRRAGYDPAGAVRFFEKLGGTGQSPRFAFLNTHPDSAKRIAAARAVAGP